MATFSEVQDWHRKADEIAQARERLAFEKWPDLRPSRELRLLTSDIAVQIVGAILGEGERAAVPPDSLYPIAIIQDRYGGAYSGGAWLAIGASDEIMPPLFGDMAITRLAAISDGRGPSGNDTEARAFWANEPAWIAAAVSPELALAALLAKQEAPHGP